MARKLAEHLKEKFAINEDGEVVLKEDFTFKSARYNKKITIPVEHIFVSTFGGKNNKRIIARCVPKITHAYLMKIAADLDINLEKPQIVREPELDENLWGYCIVKVVDSPVYGDGEIHQDTLKGNMECYAFTMMVKRAQDRAISNAIGLYSHGFYTESEDLGEDEVLASTNRSVDYDDMSREDDGVATNTSTEKEEEEEKQEEEPKEKKKATKKKTTKKQPPKKSDKKKTTSKPKKKEEEAEENDDADKDDDNEGERAFLVNRIKLISALTFMPLEEIAFNAVLEEGRDIENLDDLKDFKISSLREVAKEAEKPLDKEDLKDLLANVVKNYKTVEGLSSTKFKTKIADALDIDVEDLDIAELNIPDLYEIIDIMNLWSYTE